MYRIKVVTLENLGILYTEILAFFSHFFFKYEIISKEKV